MAFVVSASLTAVFLLGGCGSESSSKSTSAGSAATSTSTSTAATDGPSTATSSSTVSTTQSSPLAWAESVLHSQHYDAVNPDQYSTSRDLRILVGVQPDTRRMKVFFFLGDSRWLGTDTTAPSGQVAVAHQGDNTVQVTYSLYIPSDSDANPTAGTKTVTFRWDGKNLKPLDSIPAAGMRALLSRR